MSIIKIKVTASIVILAGFLASGAPQPASEFDATLLPAPHYAKGELIYENPLAQKSDVAQWIMEGPGVADFDSGWMHLFSPEEKMHHVLWCPKEFPDSFIAEWDVQNLEPDAGLCIVIFAAAGIEGKDIFDPSPAKRDGTFKQYIRGDLSNYHISFYANSPENPDRQCANLRKNSGFHYVQKGKEGIPAESEKVHTLTLIKDGPRIVFYVDQHRIIDWVDNEQTGGPRHQNGKIGFRQMSWTHFRYRNFRVWETKIP